MQALHRIILLASSPARDNVAQSRMVAAGPCCVEGHSFHADCRRMVVLRYTPQSLALPAMTSVLVRHVNIVANLRFCDYSSAGQWVCES